MRNFREIKKDLQLKKFLFSELGTLYFDPSHSDSRSLIVRHFDAELEPMYVAPFGLLVGACQNWLTQSSTLNGLVRVEQLSEIGVDFVSRRHYVYYYSTDSYDTRPNDLEVPSELSSMRNAVRNLTRPDPSEQKLQVVQTIVERSLLEPSGKTFFHTDEMKFVVVEPKIEPQDVRIWAALLK